MLVTCGPQEPRFMFLLFRMNYRLPGVHHSGKNSCRDAQPRVTCTWVTAGSPEEDGDGHEPSPCFGVPYCNAPCSDCQLGHWPCGGGITWSPKWCWLQRNRKALINNTSPWVKFVVFPQISLKTLQFSVNLNLNIWPINCQPQQMWRNVN